MVAKKKMSTKKKTAKKPVTKVLTPEGNVPSKAKPEVKRLRRDGKMTKVYFLPETEIEVPENLAGLLYPLEAARIDPTNPRKTEDLDVLVEGIRRFGMRTPLIVNEQTGEIEAGHQRRLALKRLGVNFAPMVWVDDDDITAASFNIADNRTAEIVAKWDDAALSRIFGVLKKEDALVGVGFDDDSLAELRMQLAESDLKGMNGFGRDHEGRGKGLDGEHGDEKPKGDGSWFYVEYYGEEQGKVFTELTELMADYMVTGHEIDPEFFADMVRKFRGSKEASGVKTVKKPAKKPRTPKKGSKRPGKKK